ncbi:IS30 family transposase [Nocardia sp. NPDC051750]|uniref:IS30 family transposase n=1 Tax=Nocardia sp. NPDC051750 TaxID=3364325 RepID=UPI0037A03EA2
MTLTEREEISRGPAMGCSARVIAVSLGRSPSTISREIARNGGRSVYRAAAADQLAYQRARRPKPAKLAACPPLRAMVEDKLKSLWSPEQIAGWLRRHFPDDPAMRVSHEAIYLALFDPRRKAIDRTLTQRLRTGRPMRSPKRARRPDGRGVVRERVPISERPVEVESRQIAGHWESQ